MNLFNSHLHINRNIDKLQKLQYFFCQQKQQQFNIVLFGSDYFPLPTLKVLHQNSQLPESSNDKIINKLKVVTHVKKDRSKKITNQIQKYSMDNNLDLHMPIGLYEPSTIKTRRKEWLEFKENELLDQGFNMGIVCSFGYMIPSYIIDTFNNNMMVIHPSLLPKYRGASPIHYALLENQKETGVSFIKITKKTFDAGDILHQTKIQIPGNQTYKDLSQILSQNSADNIIEVLQKYHNNDNTLPQDPSQVTPAPKLNNDDIKLDFFKPQQEVYNQYRALLGSSFSCARTFFEQEQILVEKMELPCEKQLEILNKQQQNIEQQNLQDIYNIPGKLEFIQAKKYKNNIYVKCGDGKFVVIKEWRNTKMNKAKPTFYFIEKYLQPEQLYSNNNYQFTK